MVLSRFLGGFISRNKIYCLYHTGLGIKEICFCLFCCSSGKLISEKTQKKQYEISQPAAAVEDNCYTISYTPLDFCAEKYFFFV